MNPFSIGHILPGEPFCDRKREIEELTTHARNSGSVVLFSPRRYGKTSLVKRVMADMEEKGFASTYGDFFSVTDKRSFIQKLALMVTKSTGEAVGSGSWTDTLKGLFKRIIPSIEIKPEGLSIEIRYDDKVEVPYLIEDIFTGLFRHLSRKKLKCIMVFDEFQEITRLEEGKAIEGALREQLQESRSLSCFFVGSRRRILQDMFMDSRRPFYKLCFPFRLENIPREDLTTYIIGQFSRTGKECSRDIAGQMYDYVEGYTGYVQKLAHFLWDMTKRKATDEALCRAKEKLLSMESEDFQGVFAGLTRMEKQLLLALAVEPTDKPFSREYLAGHGLSLGGVQKNLKSLVDKDIVDSELARTGVYRLTDPLFAKWGVLTDLGESV
jgi:uncharacterized protein